MDPISILFSSFLTDLSGNLSNHITSVIGSEVQAQIVEYHDQKIDYQYQLWKIKDLSVCASVKANNFSNYSSCTVTAKQFFGETCTYLQANPQQNWQYTKLKNMYCVAAANFNPTIAQITQPSQTESELWDARQKCSLLTLNARSSGSDAVEKERNIACVEYEKMKN